MRVFYVLHCLCVAVNSIVQDIGEKCEIATSGGRLSLSSMDSFRKEGAVEVSMWLKDSWVSHEPCEIFEGNIQTLLKPTW